MRTDIHGVRDRDVRAIDRLMQRVKPARVIKLGALDAARPQSLTTSPAVRR